MPTVGSVHVNAPLTNVAIQYKNLALVGEKIFPVVPVVKESDVYYVFQQEELVLEDSLRAPGAKVKEIQWDVTTSTYTAQEHALGFLLPDRIVNNADVPIRPRITTTQKLMKKILLGAERRIQLVVQDTANVGGSATPSIKWDGTSPTIERNVDTAKNSIRTTAGIDPTSIVIPYQVSQTVKRDTTVRDLIRYTIPANELLRNGDLPPVIWNLEVIVAGAIYNSANEGQAQTLTDIWTDNVLVFYKENVPSLDTLSLGYVMRVNAPIVKTYRVEERAGEMIEVSILQAEEIVATGAGYLITDTLA